MTAKAPGKAFRAGISLLELLDVFPDEVAASEWFESIYWPDERHCGHCDGTRTREASHKTMPYWSRIAASTSASGRARPWATRKSRCANGRLRFIFA